MSSNILIFFQDSDMSIGIEYRFNTRANQIKVKGSNGGLYKNSTLMLFFQDGKCQMEDKLRESKKQIKNVK